MNRCAIKAWAGTRWAVLAVAVAVSAACGGGGGGGASGVTYSGVTTAAPVTSGNAVDLTTTAYQGGSSGGSLTLVGAAVDQASADQGTVAMRTLTVARVLEDAVRAARFDAPSSDPMAAGAVVSTSATLDPGNCGGTASYSGTVNDVTGEIRATFSFNAWCNDGVTVSGSLTAVGQVDTATETLVSLEFSFTVLTVSTDTDSFSATGTIAVDLSGSSDSLTVTMDFRGSDGTVYRISDFVLTVTPDVGGESVTIEGRFYHPTHGYVDVTTPQPLVIPDGSAYPSTGQVVVRGDNSGAQLTALSTTTFQIDLDVDGDGTYETPLGTFNWADV